MSIDSMRADGLIVIVLICFACNDSNPLKVTIGRYSFDVPQGWSYTKFKGVDGYYGDITSKDGCSIRYGSSRYELTMPDSHNVEKYLITADSISENFTRIIYVPKASIGKMYLSAHNIDSTGDYGLETPSIQFVMTASGCDANNRKQVLAIFESVGQASLEN